MAGNALLEVLQEEFRALALECGADPDSAVRRARTHLETVQRDLGGRKHYLPALPRDRRQQDILADLRAGLPPAVVAAKHEVGLTTIKNVRRAARQSVDDPGLGRPEWNLK